jgi:hypothetical protein
VDHVQESEAPMSACVCHTHWCQWCVAGSVAMRKVATGDREAREGGAETCHWPGKPKRNISSLD